MHPFLNTLWQTVAGVVVPESLAVEKARQNASRRGVFELVAPRAAVLRPGDLIVVRTPGAFYKIFRRAANHKVDHLAIVMESGMFLHVGPPTIRLLPVELLLTPNRRPLVFRPKLTESELSSLLRSLRSLIGQPYDTVRVYSFVARLALSSYVGARFPLAARKLGATSGVTVTGEPENDLVYDASRLSGAAWRPHNDPTVPPPNPPNGPPSKDAPGVRTIGGREEDEADLAQGPPIPRDAFAVPADPASAAAASAAGTTFDGTPAAPVEAVICTDAILPRLLAASAEWRSALGLGPGGLSRGAASLRKRLDYFHLRSWSINDVFSVSALRPDLLTRVRLPPVHLPREFADLADEASRPGFWARRASEAREKGRAYLAAHHPQLHEQSAQVELMMRHVYETASPMFRSVLQLYQYSMRRMPPQLQAIVRLYLLLVTMRQLMQLWRTYQLLARGANLVQAAVRAPARTVLRAAMGSSVKQLVAAPKPKTSLLSRLRRRSASPPATTTTTSTRTKLRHRIFGTAATRSANNVSVAAIAAATPSTPSPLPVVRSSRSRSLSSGRNVDRLDHLLASPHARRLAGVLVEEVLLPATMPLLPRLARDTAAQMMRDVLDEVLQANGEAGKMDDDASNNDARVARRARTATPPASTTPSAAIDTAAATSAAESSSAIVTPAAVGVASSSTSPVVAKRVTGVKRAAVKSLATDAVALAFPRLARVAQVARRPATVGATTATAAGTSQSSSSSSSATAPTGAAVGAAASPAALFAMRHPHLASTLEHLQLLLLSAAAAQFADRLRSAL